MAFWGAAIVCLWITEHVRGLTMSKEHAGTLAHAMGHKLWVII